MYSPPLHRKLLPWAYAALFFLVAPLLLFYTAGYRYNTKKAAIEKYGTLIIDSTPSGASITLDGQSAVDTTPATFQELVPGWHTTRVERPGYTAWEKSLEIRAERATFADRIHLFRSAPLTQLVHEGDVRALAANTDRDTLFALEYSSPSATRALLLQSRGRISSEVSLQESLPTATDIRWQEDARAIYLDRPDRAQDPLIRLTSRGLQVTSTLAAGFWQGNDLLVADRQMLTRWNSRNGTTSQELLPTSTIASVDGIRLMEEVDGSQRLVFRRTFSEQLLALPYGDWLFFDQRDSELLLRDADRWLWITGTGNAPEAALLEGSHLRFPPPGARVEGVLVIRENELLHWTPGKTTQLLVRQTAPIREAAWHRSGDVVFFSTDTAIEALDLDERGGRRRQTLVTFDAIQDFDLIGNVLYVAATKGSERGIWMVTIE